MNICEGTSFPMSPRASASWEMALASDIFKL